jgi:hypothetical protein
MFLDKTKVMLTEEALKKHGKQYRSEIFTVIGQQDDGRYVLRSGTNRIFEVRPLETELEEVMYA